jgi:toxin-antitoxin system PIN domain toxin
MSCYLLDASVLIPLLWPRHKHQQTVRAWFQKNAAQSFASCSLTQAGFVRLTSSLDVMGEKYSLLEAKELLWAFTNQSAHTFWPTNLSLFEAMAPFEKRMQGSKQITDAYLLGIAISHGGKFATVDRAVKSLAGPKFAGMVELVV